MPAEMNANTERSPGASMSAMSDGAENDMSSGMKLLRSLLVIFLAEMMEMAERRPTENRYAFQKDASSFAATNRITRKKATDQKKILKWKSIESC
jgi:hypothetical protein